MLDAVAARYRLACTDFTKVTLALNNPVRWPHRGSPGVHLARGATLVKVGFNKEAFEPLLAAIKRTSITRSSAAKTAPTRALPAPSS